MTSAPIVTLQPSSLVCEIRLAADHFDMAAPEDVLAWAFRRFGERVAIATGFGPEGMALVDIACRIVPTPSVFFVDTGFLFAETYELRRRIESRYGIAIDSSEPALPAYAQDVAHGARLWRRDPDRCCGIRKVDPLKARLATLDAWITAIRRDQTPARRTARAVEWDARWNLVKVNPLVGWTRDEVWDYIRRHDVPYNPLHDRGFPSIGCTHCTRAVVAGEDERAGRWSGTGKTECGLHADR